MVFKTFFEKIDSTLFVIKLSNALDVIKKQSEKISTRQMRNRK